METYWINLGTAFWLGLLAAISPCPLATNVAALAFLSKEVSSPWKVVLNGFLYAAGRSIAYLIVSGIVAGSLISVFKTAQFLQSEMNQILGPVLIFAGLFILRVLRFPGIDSDLTGKFGVRLARIKGAGPLLLGILFAFAFCPVSAGLFFGSLIPLSVGTASVLLLPACFGLGTAIPVLGSSVLLVAGTRSLTSAFGWMGVFEKWAGRVTGAVFLAVGCYLSFVYLLGGKLF